jgi:hypothetical protein
MYQPDAQENSTLAYSATADASPVYACQEPSHLPVHSTALGFPPEFIGMKALNQLNEQEWQTLNKHYLKMQYDLKVVGEYVSSTTSTCWLK